MRQQPWQRELLEEQASPALEASFAASALRLARSLTRDSFDALERIYRDPRQPDPPPPQLIAALLAGAGLLNSVESGRALLDYASGDDRDPFLAIAAQTLQWGNPDDQNHAVEILQDLAERALFAEAAALLAVSREHLPLPEEARVRWRQHAEALWPPSVRGFHGHVTRMTPFGSYFAAHVLAARPANAPEGVL